MYALGYDMSDKNDIYELGVLMDKVRKTMLKLYQLPDEEFNNTIQQFDDVEFKDYQ